MKLDDINMDDTIKVSRAVAIAFNSLAPLFNLTPRDEDALTDHLTSTLIKVLNVLPEDK